VARWVGQADPHSLGRRHPRPRPPDPGCPSRGAPRSRHHEQRRRQSRGLLPGMPPDPRPPGASAQAVAHAVPAQGARGFVQGSLHVAAAENTEPLSRRRGTGSRKHDCLVAAWRAPASDRRTIGRYANENSTRHRHRPHPCRPGLRGGKRIKPFWNVKQHRGKRCWLGLVARRSRQRPIDRWDEPLWHHEQHRRERRGIGVEAG
jgi:hypothetical protein